MILLFVHATKTACIGGFFRGRHFAFLPALLAQVFVHNKVGVKSCTDCLIPHGIFTPQEGIVRNRPRKITSKVIAFGNLKPHSGVLLGMYWCFPAVLPSCSQKRRIRLAATLIYAIFFLLAKLCSHRIKKSEIVRWQYTALSFRRAGMSQHHCKCFGSWGPVDHGHSSKFTLRYVRGEYDDSALSWATSHGVDLCLSSNLK